MSYYDYDISQDIPIFAVIVECTRKPNGVPPVFPAHINVHARTHVHKQIITKQQGGQDCLFTVFFPLCAMCCLFIV